MSLVLGKDVLLTIYKGGIANGVACNASCTIDVDTDVYETTFLDSGSFRQWIPNKHTIVITGSGPIFLGEPITVADVMGWQLNRTLVEFDYTITDNTNITRVHGMGYFTKCSVDGSVGQAATCNYTIQVNGAITFYATNASAGADDDKFWDWEEATEGQTVYADPEFEGATVVYLSREGIGIELITTGSPSTSQVLFDSVTGSFTFGTPLNANEWVHMIYQSA